MPFWELRSRWRTGSHRGIAFHFPSFDDRYPVLYQKQRFLKVHKHGLQMVEYFARYLSQELIHVRRHESTAMPLVRRS